MILVDTDSVRHTAAGVHTKPVMRLEAHRDRTAGIAMHMAGTLNEGKKDLLWCSLSHLILYWYLFELSLPQQSSKEVSAQSPFQEEPQDLQYSAKSLALHKVEEIAIDQDIRTCEAATMLGRLPF